MSGFSGEPAQDEFRNGAGFIGRIPVRNLWLLMLYASDLLRQLPDRQRVAVESNPDEIADLVAEVLARTVEKRLRRNLTFGYERTEADLSRVRGRIRFLDTERRQLLHRGLVACSFDRFTMDTPRNRYVRAALESIARVVKPPLAHRCRALAAQFVRMGVVGGEPTRAQVANARLGHHDAEDQAMLSAAQLALDLSLPTETSGRYAVRSPDREIVWVRKLYEKAVAGFYDVVLTPTGWAVEAGKPMAWPLESQTAGIEKILPSMRTDIVLSHSAAKRRTVIDTKFNEIVTSGWFREESLRSGHVYQIYAYLRSQEEADALARSACGLLLHPSLGDMIDESITLQGHRIRFATVDLAAEAADMRTQLLTVVDCGHLATQDALPA